MKITRTDRFYIYYSFDIMGIETFFRQNKVTGEVQIHLTDQMVKGLLGFNTVDEMMQHPKFQKMMQKYSQLYDGPLFIPAFNNETISHN